MINTSERVKTNVSCVAPKCVYYHFVRTKLFGEVLLGCIDDNMTTSLCHLHFAGGDGEKHALNYLQRRWPKAQLQENEDLIQMANAIFDNDETKINITLFGTEFQKRVWLGMLQGPLEPYTYTDLAESIGQPRAVRAVANAVARNELAVVVPCHRVINKGTDVNKMSKYRWGGPLKRLLLDYEAGNTITANQRV